MKYSQANRALSISTLLGPDALLLEKIHATEAISELFSFELDLLAPSPVSFEKLLGQPASIQIRLPNQSGRHVQGIITEITKGRRLPGASGRGELLRYRAVLSPAAWRLTRRVQSRIFQQQSVPEIVNRIVHDDWHLPLNARLTATYPARNFCVQYQESDWAFVCRLMEDEGISFFFEHGEKEDRLVLADNPPAYAELPEFATVEYSEVEGGTRTAPTVRDWEQTQKLGAYRYTVADYHFEKPEDRLTAHRDASGSVTVGAIAHPLGLQHTVNDVPMFEVFEFPGQFAHHHDAVKNDGSDDAASLQSMRDDLQRRVRIRHEEETAAQMRIRGDSDCGQFLPGFHFKLARHFDGADPPGDDDRYLLTRVETTASQEGAYTTNPEMTPALTNRFECVPAKWPYRPRRHTPKPRIEGLQTAVVVGPKGEEVFVDRFGRVKVLFRWDREKHPEGYSSCWVRVAQFWAGKGWGAFFWPRVGHEVVIAFEEGDPDRPMIVGSVYNAVNMPPLELPGYVTITGVKSCIYGGNPNKHFNSILIYDTPGKEYVHVHSEKSERTHAEQHKLHYVPGVNFTINGDY